MSEHLGPHVEDEALADARRDQALKEHEQGVQDGKHGEQHRQLDHDVGVFRDDPVVDDRPVDQRVGPADGRVDDDEDQEGEELLPVRFREPGDPADETFRELLRRHGPVAAQCPQGFQTAAGPGHAHSASPAPPTRRPSDPAVDSPSAATSFGREARSGLPPSSAAQIARSSARSSPRCPSVRGTEHASRTLTPCGVELVEQAPALGRELHEGRAAIPGIGQARDEAGKLRAVHEIGDGPRHDRKAPGNDGHSQRAVGEQADDPGLGAG